MKSRHNWLQFIIVPVTNRPHVFFLYNKTLMFILRPFQILIRILFETLLILTLVIIRLIQIRRDRYFREVKFLGDIIKIRRVYFFFLFVLFYTYTIIQKEKK